MRKKWTEEEIKLLETNWETKLVSELEELLPNRSRDSIFSKMKHMGLRLTENELQRRMKLGRSLVVKDNFKTNHSLKIENLENTTLQILLGSMLGDGCCNKQSKNLKHYRFCESHSMKQRDYLEWKYKMLADFKPRLYVRTKHERVDLITLTHPIFDLLRSKFYVEGENRKSIISTDISEKLDLLGVMIWYLDDGHFGKTGGHSMGITAKGWSQDGLHEISRILNKKFGLSFYVYSCKHYDGRNQVLKIPYKDKKYILSVWQDFALKYCLPECMIYKL